MPAELPSGTVTLLFTDIEGSTRMLQELGAETYVRALTDHRRLLREAFTSHGGVEVEMQGDSFFFAFPYARDAVAAAVAAQRALAEHAWEQQPIKVRIGLHTGEPMQSDGLYAGIDVHWAARVMSAAHGGQVILSARTAELASGELDVDLIDLGQHRLKDLTAAQRLYQADRGEFPPLKTLGPKSNLPVAASPLIGREPELRDLAEVLRTARAVTVTGPGGTGKTRLALQAAADVVEDYPDGVFWVPLAGLRDPRLVPASVAQALEAQGSLADYLSRRELLLVLDNFEHLLDAAADLSELLAHAPGVTALVTSRGPLHIAAEREFPLDPLDLTDGVTLFLERARASGPELQADDDVAEICRRLDCLPLAIELAASRTKLLQPGTLLERLDRRLPLLTGGRRDAPEHQRTLIATIEWSVDLLEPQARALFARLGVFSGSFGVRAAEEICGAEVDTLTALVDLSLLKPLAGDRMLMLETIREFARSALDQTGETTLLRQRHAEWYVNLGLETARVHNPIGSVWLETIHEEYDNFRVALETLSEGERPKEILQLVGALGRFWSTRGFAAEGLGWIERALAVSGGAPSTERAAALDVAETLARHLQDFGRAATFARERLAYSRAVGDMRGIAWSLASISADHQSRGDFPAARTALDEALAAAHESGDRDALAFVLNELGFVAYGQGDFTVACERYGQALAVARELSDDRAVGAVSGNVAMVLLAQGRHRDAVPLVEESLRLAVGLGHGAGLAEALDQTAMLATLEGDQRTGAFLMGAAAAAWEQIGTELDFAFRDLRDRTAAACRAAAGDAVFEELREQGRSVSWTDAAEEARRALSALAPAAVST